MTVRNPMTQLYARLHAAGIDRKYVRDTVLAEWWHDEIALEPVGFSDACMQISRCLGIQIASLRQTDVPLRFSAAGPCKFKKREGTDQVELSVVKAIGVRLAEISIAAFDPPTVTQPVTASQVRQAILDRGAACVGLAELLDYCWSIGIPVLYLARLPSRAKRPHGMAVRVGTRPVILLAQKREQSAWHLFDLAHELGHILLGHVAENGSLIDEQIEQQSLDQEESEANRAAVEILTGDESSSYCISGRWPSARTLAAGAARVGREGQVDPGHIILNYAHHMGDSNVFRIAQAALKLTESRPRGIDLMVDRMFENLDWENLPEDSSAYLSRVAGRAGDPAQRQ